MTDKINWISLIYKFGSLPSRYRVSVWRRFREAGAVSFQPGIALLPLSDPMLAFAEKIRQDIIRFGGEATVIGVSFFNGCDEQAAIDRYEENIRCDMSEIEKLFCRLLGDLDEIDAVGKARVAALEEKLNVFRKSRRNFEKIKRRDHFKTVNSEHIEKLMEALLDKINRGLLLAGRENGI